MATLDSQLRRYRRAMNMQSINDAIQQEIVNIAATDESKLEDIATRKNRIKDLRASLLERDGKKTHLPAEGTTKEQLDEMRKARILNTLETLAERSAGNQRSLMDAEDRDANLPKARPFKNELFVAARDKVMTRRRNTRSRFNDRREAGRERYAETLSRRRMGAEDRPTSIRAYDTRLPFENELYAATKEMSSIGRANRRTLDANRSGMEGEDHNQSRNVEYSNFDNILFGDNPIDETKPARRPAAESQLKIPITLSNGVVVEFSEREHNEIIDPSASPTLTKAKQYAAALKVNPGNTKDPKKIMDKIRVAIGETRDPKSRIPIKS